MPVTQITTEDGRGNVLHQETVELPDPEPTLEDRVAAVETLVLDPAGDQKSVVDKLQALQDVLVTKGLLKKGDIADVAADAAVEEVAP